MSGNRRHSSQLVKVRSRQADRWRRGPTAGSSITPLASSPMRSASWLTPSAAGTWVTQHRCAERGTSRSRFPSPVPFPARARPSGGVGLVRFHDPLEHLRIAPRRRQKTPAERRAHRHVAARRRGLASDAPTACGGELPPLRAWSRPRAARREPPEDLPPPCLAYESHDARHSSIPRNHCHQCTR